MSGNRISLLVALVTLSCSDSTPPVTVSEVVTSPPGILLETGSTAVLSAAALNANGDTVAGAAISWSSSDSMRVTISPVGLVSGIRPGLATIIAAVSGVQAAVPVAVVPAVASIVIIPDTMIVHVGDVAFPTVHMTDSSGAILLGRFSVWTVSDTSIIRLTTLGPTSAGIQVTALAAGTVWLAVFSGVHSDTSTITVLP
jgi:Big-like domain-containing protein